MSRESGLGENEAYTHSEYHSHCYTHTHTKLLGDGAATGGISVEGKEREI